MRADRNTASKPENRCRTRHLRAKLGLTAALAAATTGLAAPAGAQPLLPGLPDIPGLGVGMGGILPAPNPPFAPPTITPGVGETVGVAQPVIINFPQPVTDRTGAQRAIQITSSHPVAGHFYWFNNRQVRWRPTEFWPAGTDLVVHAGASYSAFHIGDAVIATADDNTKTITITRNGQTIKTMPTSMGKPGHETPSGTYIVGEKFRKMWMDSSTYGVPATAPEGYRLEVEYATRIAGNGIFVHAAPWSVRQQGVTDVSHGCLNVSTANAQWFFDTMHKGDAVIVKNTGGPTADPRDGLGDWNG